MGNKHARPHPKCESDGTVETDEERESPSKYCKGGYHPVKIGDVFNKRYTIVSKLGWGAYSTVWQCSDNKDHKFKALKIVRSAADGKSAAMNEIKLLEHVNRYNNTRLVHLLDHFNFTGVNGTHICMVFEVLGDNLWKLIIKSGYKGLPLTKVKSIVRQVLEGLDYLHTKCGIMHTDIKLENICLNENETCSDNVRVTITDLGNGCWVNHHYNDPIQSRPYRCPEVILGAHYNANADVWSVGCLAFELATGDFLFRYNSDYDDICVKQDENHLVLMVKLLGDVPKGFARKCKYVKKFFTAEGKLRGFQESLESCGVFKVLTEKYEWDVEEAQKFSDFLLPMLAIDPSKRASAKDSLMHEWLKL
uniref:non-specific serine/threonine protein kinase n=1 Tax=Strigamia maritima TaxID=126957 RepID=T1J3B4_STRMM